MCYFVLFSFISSSLDVNASNVPCWLHICAEDSEGRQTAAACQLGTSRGEEAPAGLSRHQRRIAHHHDSDYEKTKIDVLCHK